MVSFLLLQRAGMKRVELYGSVRYLRFICIHYISSFKIKCCVDQLSVYFLGLRRNGSSSQIINQAQNFLEQLPWHSNLSQMESDVTTMADDLGADLDQLLP